MNKKFLLLAALVLSFNASHAQSSWQWAVRGGSADNTSTLGHGSEENVYDMATDPNGNNYSVSIVAQTDLNIDGHPKTSYSDYGNNWCIASFKCGGAYRWSKIIGGYNAGGNPVAIKTDTLGGIYVLGGMFSYYGFSIDSDTTIPGTGVVTQLMLLKYDSAGNFQWYRMPEPDTITDGIGRQNDIFDMSVDKNGDIYILCLLTNGSYGGGAYIVSSTATESFHILKYNSAGVCTGGFPMDISVTGYPPQILKMKRNANDGRFYITGSLDVSGGPLAFGGVPITHTMFAGCFSSAGGFLWQKQDTMSSYAGNFTGLDLDNSGNIFLTGATGNNDLFNGYLVTNGLSSIPYPVPLIMKLDSNGNNLWAKNGYVSAATIFCSAVVVNGSEVDISGAYGSEFLWPGLPDTLNIPINTYLYNVFITRFDAGTGTILELDTAASDLYANEFPSAMAADKFGNFYIGGDFEDQMYFSCGDTIVNIGGETDFFVAKYGSANCDTVLATLQTPGPATAAQALRIYPNPATDELTIENAAPGTTAILFNTVGQQVSTTKISSTLQTMNTTNLLPGAYLLQMVDLSGNRTNKTIIKQ